MRGGRVKERRPSNKTIRHTKQREYLIFSSKGNLNTLIRSVYNATLSTFTVSGGGRHFILEGLIHQIE